MTDQNTPAEPNESERTLSKLLAKKDQDAMAVAADLLTENAALRADKRGLNTRIGELEGQKPKDGQRVLSKAESDRYDAFMALGGDDVKGDPAKLKGALEAGVTAQKTAHAATVREGLRQLGYEPTDRLLRDFEGVTLSVADSSDKKSKVGTVKAGDAEQDFGAWAKAAGLESDLERYKSAPLGVQVLGQMTGDRAGPTTHEDRVQETRGQISI